MGSTPKTMCESCPVVGFIHDAVLQWAYGVNKTLQQEYPPNDGVRITMNILNTSFKGITGNVAIDGNGDRKPNLRYKSNVMTHCFLNMALNSSSQNVKSISNMERFRTYSIMGGNIRLLIEKYDMNVRNVVKAWN